MVDHRIINVQNPAFPPLLFSVLGDVGLAEGHGLGHGRRVAKACGGSKRILAGLFIDRGPGPLPHPASHVQYTEWEAGWGSGPGPHLTEDRKSTRLNSSH